MAMRLDRSLDRAGAVLGHYWRHHPSCPPVLAHAAARAHCRTVRYGPHGHWADIWRSEDTPAGAPVLLFVPGGAWMSGRRVGQGYALFADLVERGYVCVSIDYRTSPRHRWPAHIEDVRDALNWVRDTFDPPFLALAGASAGGHLASLAGLTADFPPDAVISLYGVYDWCCRADLLSWGLCEVVESVVVQRRRASHPQLYRDASPIHQVHPDAPHFLLVHGTRDVLTPLAGARAFHQELGRISRRRAELLEVPRSGHGFDAVNPRATRTVVAAIADFLHEVSRRHADCA